MNSGESRSTPLADRPLAWRRYRAPAQDDEVLADPPLASLAEALATNLALTRDRADRSGLPRWADDARREAVRAAWEYTRAYRDVAPPGEGPLLMSGHQPALFHPGVWFKNFVLGGLAARVGASAINLVIDGDTLRQPAIRVPVAGASDSAVASLAFDGLAPEMPWECRAIADANTFASFGQRAVDTMAGWNIEPLARDYWPRVLARSREGLPLGACLAQARHQVEGDWGLQTLELPQNRLCELAAFQAFVADLLGDLPRFCDVYNRALHEYRSLYKVRSQRHPAPELMRQDGWHEAPFWLWTDAAPARRRMFVRFEGPELRVSDRGTIDFVLPSPATGDPARTAAVLFDLPRRGVRLRSRALATTLFARLFSSDLFLHGIGGGKYDVVADALMARHFGCEPPQYAVVSATLRLPLPHEKANEDDLRRLRTLLRELTWHAEKHVSRPADARQAAAFDALAAAKAAWIAGAATTDGARQRRLEIQRLNQALQPWAAPRRAELTAEIERLTPLARRHAALSSREFAFCLFPAASIERFLTTDRFDSDTPVAKQHGESPARDGLRKS